jgi:hypothetical protein
VTARRLGIIMHGVTGRMGANQHGGGGFKMQGYADYAEVEIFSAAWWSRPPSEVLDTCIACYKTVV